MQRPLLISVVVPMLNEEKSLPYFLKSLQQQIFFVNGLSPKNQRLFWYCPVSCGAHHCGWRIL